MNSRRFRRLLRFPLAALLSIGLAAAAAHATTQIKYVRADAAGGGDGNSWATAYNDLQSALAAANGTDTFEIWIKTGVYKPTSGTTRTTAFELKSHVVLRGGFAGTESAAAQRVDSVSHTVLSGDIGTADAGGIGATTSLGLSSVAVVDTTATAFADNSYNVLRAVSVGGITLDRLVITGGCATNAAIQTAYIDSMIQPGTGTATGYVKELDPTVTGGGLFAQNSTVTIVDCTFAHNAASGPGGGIVARSGSIAISTSTFVRNSSLHAGGAAALQDVGASASGNTFYGNSAGLHGGALFVETSTGHNNARAFLGQLVVGLNTSTYAARQLPANPRKLDASNPLSYYPAAKDVSSIAKPIISSLTASSQTLTATGVTATSQATKLFGARVGGYASSFSTIYTGVSIAFAAFDLGVQIAQLLGVSPDDPFVQTWTDINKAFNDYCTPLGLLITIAKAILGDPPVDHVARATEITLAEYNERQNTATHLAFSSNRFELNTAAGVGGAVAIFRANVDLLNSWFVRNEANVGGGAVASFSYNSVSVENSAFVGNQSYLGHSALSAASRSQVRCLNNAFVRNNAVAANGRAVSIETGSDAFIGNSVFWGNTAGDSATTGADVFAARYADLDADSQKGYRDAGDSHGIYVGTCNIRSSDVQGLNSLALGTAMFANLAFYNAPDGYETADGNPNVGEGIQPTVTAAASGNFSRDPILTNDVYPHPLSPLVNAGSDAILLVDYVHDLAGNSRRIGAIDIGPIESDGNFGAGTILYVNSALPTNGDGLTWATAFNNLASAVAAPLAPGGQIWVAYGGYYPTSGTDRSATLTLRPGVAIIGGFKSGDTAIAQSSPVAQATIVSGGIGTNSTADNSYTLVTGTTLASDSDLAGIPRVLQGLYFTEASGGPAVSCVAPLVVRNCVFHGNGAADRALKITFATYGESYSAQIIDSTFENNAGGAVDSTVFNVDVIRSNFYGNTAPLGAALYFHGPSYARGGTTRIERSAFAGNAATAGRGGAIYYEGKSLLIAQCVVVDNTATPAGGDTSTLGGAGLWQPTEADPNARGQVTIENSIFYGNRLAGTFAPTTIEHQQLGLPVYAAYQNAPAPVLTGNDIEGLRELATPGGTGGNFDFDPFFVNEAGHDFHLADDSMLINRGVSYVSGTDTTVLTGANDIGVFENASTTVVRPTVALTFTALQPTATGRTFTFTLPSGTSGRSNFVWEVRRPDGSGYVTVTADAYTSGLGTGLLTLTNPPHTWNGSLYRVTFTDTDGKRTVSAPATLVAAASFLYVVPGGAGTKDGTSWANAMASPADALAIATSYTQVFVAGGDYVMAPAGMQPGVLLYGGFAGTETLAAQRTPGAHETILRNAVISVSGVATYPTTPTPTVVPNVIDGFTIKAASGVTSGGFVFGSANASLSNLRLNFAGITQSGISATQSTLAIADCEFTDSTAAMIFAGSSTVTVRHSTFTGNGVSRSGQSAGGIAAEGGCVLTVTDSTFTDNFGYHAGAIDQQQIGRYSPLGGVLTVARCRFLDNGGGYSGAIYVDTPAASRVTNSLFARNYSVSTGGPGGGAISLSFRNPSVAFVHCTFVGNTSLTYGAAIDSGYGGSYALTNSIVWNNTGPRILGPNGTVTNSFIQGASYDPLLAPASADFALGLGSPLIDRGGTDSALSGTTDLSGATRFYNGGAADLGASEFAAASPHAVYVRTKPADQSVFVERAASFTIDASVDANTGSTPIVWQYYDGSAWQSVSGLSGWTVNVVNGVSTLTNPAVTSTDNGRQFRATIPAVSGVVFPVTLTVKPRVVLYVDSRVTASGNGHAWAQAFKTIGEALAAATGDTDIWVATGDYTESNLTPPFGARLYFGFTGTETALDQRDPVANPVRIGSPLSDRSLVVADVTTLIPPLTLSAGQTARWQVDTGGGNFVDLVADADHVFSLVNGVPGLAVTGDFALNGYRYRVVVSDGTGDIFTSLPAQITVIPRPTVYVDASVSGGAHTGANWANAFNDLAAALAAYPAFADFKVAAGTYVAPAGSSFFLRRSLTLTGGYVAGTETRDPVAHRTILAQTDGGTTSYAVTLATNADRGTVDALSIVDGFVFQTAGTGLSIRAASPIVRNCRFEGCIGGVVVADGNPAFADCTFTDQLDSAVIVRGTAQVVFDRADFERNGAGVAGRTVVTGGAINLGNGENSPHASVVVNDGTFAGNFTQYGQAAIFVGPSATLAVNRSTFTGNKGGVSAGVSSTVAIRHSLFARNTGGPVIAASGSLDLAFSTVADNDSYSTAISASGTAVIRDSIVWGNTQLGRTGDQFYQLSLGASRTLARDLIQGLSTLAGTQLLPFAPRFVDAVHGDYRLAADSPAIDAGAAADLLDGETDLDGAARTVGTAPDLGALEAATIGTPDYGFGLPASLAGPAGSTLTLAYAAPVGSSVVWQYSTDGSTWLSINPTSGTGSNPPGAGTVTVQSLSQLSLTGIQQALDGVSLRMVVVIGGMNYVSAAVPVTIQPFEKLYVDASVANSGDGLSWGTAFKTFSEALAAADVTHRVIWVAEGTYRPATSAPDSRTFHLAGFNVLGGFPAGGGTIGQRDPTTHPTIFTGLPANGTDPRSSVVVALTNGGLFESTLDGVIVENGQTGVVVQYIPPHLANLVIRGHTATGLAIVGAYNTAGGSVVNCVIENNAGVNGGGVSLTTKGSPVFERDIIRGNTATGNGGGVYVDSPDTVTFTSVLISGNVADLGGGVYATSGTCALDQATLAGNRARRGAAVFATRYATLRDSIVWGNRATAGGSDPQLDTSYAVRYVFTSSRTDVEQTTLSSGVVRFDPVFYATVDAAVAPSTGGDYRLRDTSPAIDAGDNAVVAGYTLDLAGQPRVVTTVDLGAYESSATGVTPLAITSQPADLTYRRSAGSNTFSVAGTGYTSIAWQYAAPGGEWATLVGVSGFSGADTATLTVADLLPALNGYRFRAVLTAADGSVAYSDEKILTVYSPRYYVNGARSGSDAGDGLGWATAFRSLDAVLALPYDAEGTEIWLAAGSYTPATSFVLRPGVSVYGGFAGTESALGERDPGANVTALVGAAGAAPVVSIPFVAGGVTTPVGLDGVTIRDSAGAGINYLANFPLNLNQVKFSGLGTALYQYGGTATITASAFTGNRVAIYSKFGPLSVQRCEFRGNGATGGDPVVSLAGGGNLQAFENSLFAGNATTPIYSRGTTRLRNVTIANNLGGTAVDAGTVTIQNCIVWGNRTAGSTTVPTQVSGTLSSPAGNAIELVTSSVPVFAAPAAATAAPTTSGDYELAGTSAVIETGDNTYANTSGTDLAGQPRLHGAHVEPGAYEYESDPYFVTSPANAVGTPLAAAHYAVSASAPVSAYAWDESIDGGANWTPLAESAAYAGVATAALTVTGDATFAGHRYRARLQFTDGPEVASDSARFDYVSLDSATTAGFATPAVFTASATGSVTSYAWQVSVGGGAFATIANNANYAGATTAVLTVTGDSSFTNRSYRVRVTFAASPTTDSNALAFTYAAIAATPATVTRNGTLGYGDTAFGFTVTGGIDAATLTDAAFAVHTQFGGRFNLADLAAPAIAGNNVTLAFTAPLHAGEHVAITTTSALHRADGISTQPQVWEFHNGVRSGAGIFDTAAPLAGAASGATAFALGDLDNDADGTIDALVATAAGNRVYVNDGLGNFTAAGPAFGSGGAVAIVLGSVTNGGALDAAIATAGGAIEIWTNDGSGAFTLHQTITGESAQALALGDLDGDGDLDLFVARAAGNRVYLNDGSGTFAAAAGAFGSGAGVSVALGDVDNDGDLDALVGAGSSSTLWLNQGGGVFAAASQSFAGRPADRVALADFNRDGRLDLVFTRANAPTQVWRNQGGAAFTAATTGLGGGVATLGAGDVDGDGRPDLVLTDATGALRTWAAQSDGSFVRADNQPALAFGNRVELADLDGDGALDLFGLDASGTPSVSLYRVVASVGPEDADLTLSAAGFTREGGDNVTHVRIASLPANGTLLTAASAPVNGGDTFTLADAAALIYRPGANLNGFDSFTWSASTDGGASFGATPIAYWVIIAAVVDNVAPAADAFTVAQGGTATVLAGGATSVLANDVNVD
ncbi:MAG TPA: FG-GAP-like repeat-containing protein, partial [Opitutus sp.]|nr:FG-GAP-like repeat-containing protein [Opitutus sp.]